ncbi:hypothetical protein DNL40_08395 [Xylanimonas oleitrophica]|uniref:NfeD-like C-terminal domain-containing protein n=1 Tax=Xylanimonas oleitrophica TaxID=2607479 RepID=A0A2W5XTR2_9MICO|nr:hypothetical protein [Xylanimonas oleitrophica]PZR53508.1 hypothetical protein DNL40_08395 [Xylanimonas oleitrophica]
MLTAFLVVAGIATVLVVLAFVFDGVFDIFDVDLPGDGAFSVMGLFGGVASFGWTAVAVIAMTAWTALTVIGVALAVGVAVVVGMSALARVLRRSSAQGATSGDLVGAEGAVVEQVSPGAPGLVRVTYHGAPRTVTAHSEVVLEPGTQVVVDRAESMGEVHVVALARRAQPQR